MPFERMMWIRNKEADQDQVVQLETFFEKENDALANTFKQLELNGDRLPDALWNMCGRFKAGRPWRPMKYLESLYKLREWYPTFEYSANGEIQWRIIKVLSIHELQLKDAADEADNLIAHWPKCNYVVSGDALWVAATNREQQGHVTVETENNKTARPILQKALKQYVEFKLAHPRHRENHKLGPKSPHPGISECEFRIGKLKSFLGDR